MRKLLDTLFLTRDDIKVTYKRNALELVSDERMEPVHIPFIAIEKIVVIGKAIIDDTAIVKCIENGISIYYLNKLFKFKYRIMGDTTGNVEVRKKQYLISEADNCLEIAKKIITYKIINSINNISRFVRNHHNLEDSLKINVVNLKNILSKIETASSKEELMGLEGRAARLYFDGFGDMVLSSDEKMAFNGRTKRPPLDRCNALLSYAYTMLSIDYITACECYSLDPYVGFLHSDRSGKPSLALDLMEEMRPAIVDRFVLKLINTNIISSDMFDISENGVYLNSSGKRIFFDEWNKYKKKKIMLEGIDDTLGNNYDSKIINLGKSLVTAENENFIF